VDKAGTTEQPDDSVIRFACKHCQRRISVPKIHAGEKAKCPKCKNINIVPSVESAVTAATQSTTGNSKHDSKRADFKLTFLDIPQKQKAPPATPDKILEDLRKLEAEIATDKAELVPERKLPWLIDIFLYPLNLAGIIHLICLWLLIFFLCPLVMDFLRLGIEYIPVVYALPVAYALYYFAECIRDSAGGGYRAPDFWMHPTDSDKWDCIFQSLAVFGCIAVSFWPVAVYYAVTGRSDLIYWLLLACGGFFFPMVLLAVVLFDSYNALKPMLIIGSIFHTFLPYCGMVLLFYGGALLFVKIDSRLYGFRLLPTVPFILRAVQLYLVFVAVGFLGRFYWKYRDKLNWEV
jgi:phage FluMu protein Com